MSDIQSQLQQTLGSAYTLDRELGGGGMSRVFVADERSLGRKVVIKVLAPELAAEISSNRFQREIRLAASLQQANIVPVLSAGESEGLPYYTMPYVEGESLRQRLGAGVPLAIPEVVRILGDVARALSYAHAHGIVHRDIKPDNVLLSHGTAVVTDFGIAKALSASRAAAASPTLTQLGSSLGTPAYMAPEQAAGDPEVDHRADIYALGCMAYELLTGRPPFVGRTPQRLLAAHMGETPQPVAELRPDTPAELAALVMRCLEKDANRRPQRADELVHVLDTVSSGGLPAMPRALLGARHGVGRALSIYAAAFLAVVIIARAAIIAIGLPDWVLPGAILVMALVLPVILFTAYVHRATHRALTTTPQRTPGGSVGRPGTLATLAMKASPHVSWRRTTRWGAYALGVFVLLVTGFMTLRAMGIGPAGSLFVAGALDENDRVLVADFAAPTADSALGGVVAEALRANLTQSRAIAVMTPTAIADGLRRMRQAPEARLTPALARELAEREGAKAFVTGEVASAGAGFILTARLMATSTGDEIVSFRRAAKDATDIIPAIDRLTRDLRGRIGESLRDVRQSPPLVRVATASLPALRKFSEGVHLHYRVGDYAAAAKAFEEAIRIDSTFASAYLRAYHSYRNGSFNTVRGRAMLQRAYELRDRMTALDAAYTEGINHDLRGRRDSAIQAYRRVVAIDPRESVVLNTLGILLGGVRDYAGAEAAYRQAIAARDGNVLPAMNLSTALVGQGKLAEARRYIDSLRRNGYAGSDRNATLMSRLASVNMLEGNYDAASAQLDTAAAPPRNLISRTAATFVAEFLETRGQVRAGLRLRDSLRRSDEAAGNIQFPIRGRIALAMDTVRGFIALGRMEDAGRVLDGIIARHPVVGEKGMGPAQLLDVAFEYAFTGQPAKARALVARFDREVTDTVALRGNRQFRRSVDAQVAVAEGKYVEAIARLRQLDTLADGLPAACDRCTLARLADAFDRAGMADSALAAWEAYVRSPHPFHWAIDSRFYATARRRLGELYESRGDVTNAARQYRALLKLWRNPDPELQPRVAEVRRRLSRLADVEGTR